MEPVFPITALTKEPREVKERAREGLVRITENGKGAWVFMSEEVFEQRIALERDQAVYEAYVSAAVGQGAQDISAGRYVTSRAEMFLEAKRRRDNACAQ